MPGIVDGIAHYITTCWGLEQYGTPPFDFDVVGFWADLTDEEAETFDASNRVIHRLTPDSRILRGTSKNQGPLIAKELQLSHDNSNPIPIASLKLQGVHYCTGAIVLDLGKVWLRLAYLTHTSIQVYTHERWSTVVRVPQKKRKFSVGFAIECDKFVLAFVSQDKLFQPSWALSREELGTEPPNIHKDYTQFLTGVVEWIRGRSHLNRMDFAANVIRGENHVWAGIGSYTISEVFFIAGIPACIREWELFTNPSRTARLCDACWTVAHLAWENLPGLLRRSWDNGMLAPNEDQRRLYADTLHIYGKLRVVLPSRLLDVAENHNNTIENLCKTHPGEWYRSEYSDTLPDAFEPTYLKPALKSNSKVQLGHLIFGSTWWYKIQDRYNLPKSCGTDPLTVYFNETHQATLENIVTYIYSPTIEEEVFIDTTINKRQFFPFVYSTSMSGKIYSLIKQYPDSSKPKPGAKIPTTVIELEEISDYSSANHSTAIGPLEYKGNGTKYRIGKRKLILPVAGYMNEGLRLSEVSQIVVRQWREQRFEKEKKKLIELCEKNGVKVTSAQLDAIERRKFTPEEKAERDKRVEDAIKEYKEVFGDPEETKDVPDLEERPAKRRMKKRVTADQVIRNSAQEIEDTVLGSSSRVTRGSRRLHQT